MSVPVSTLDKKPTRLVSLDAYRGAVMLILAASGFGIGRLTSLGPDAPLWEVLDRSIWMDVAWYFQHPLWISQFHTFGVSPWDLIQPAFMFMVGVAMPFSSSRRELFGELPWRRHVHAFIRALVLVLLGVFLQSQRSDSTNWIFPNVLSQIGLGYFFVYLMLGWRRTTQVGAIALILIGYWLFFRIHDVPADYDFAAVGVESREVTQLEAKIAELGASENAEDSAELTALKERLAIAEQTWDESQAIFAGNFEDG